MPNWFRSRWEAFQRSYDAPEAAVQSAPGPILIGVGGLTIALLIVGFVPYVSAASQMRLPWLPVCTGLLGGVASYTAYRHKATGPIGTACMLIDTALYTSSLTLASLLSSGSFSIAFAIVLGLFQLTFPASVYTLTLLLALAMTGPPLLLLAALGASPSTWVIIWVGCTLALTTSYRTGQRRALSSQNENLRTVLEETTRVIDGSLDNAITASLLDVGHFLHELRNLQALQKMNLEYISEEARLDEDCAAALRDAMSARESEERLIGQAIEDIRRRAQPTARAIDLESAVRSSLSSSGDSIPTAITFDAPPFQITGNHEHLQLVLQNIRRNASQAGATGLELRVQLDPGSKAALLELTDNGPGIAPEMVDSVFQPFATGKSTGTGLGLYLARRYVELMGGRIEAGNAPGGGARFSIVLPGRLARSASPPPPAASPRATESAAAE